MAEAPGFEPEHTGIKNRGLTAWLYLYKTFAVEVPIHVDVSNPDKQAIADRDFGLHPQSPYYKSKVL